MKRTQKAVPATEHGKVPGDGSGSRPFMMMPEKGGRNTTTNEAKRGAGGVAPRPSNSSQQYLGSSSASGPMGASMARVPGAASRPSGPAGGAGSFNPIRNNAMTNLRSKAVGQPNPDTGAASTAKPKRKGLGSAFFGEYKE